MLIPRSVLSALTVASDTTSSRYALGGLHFERAGDRGYAVATDGRRLIAADWADSSPDVPEIGGLRTGPAVDCEFAQQGAVVPSGACKELAKLAKPGVRAAGKLPQTGFVALEEATANGKIKFAATDGATVAAREVESIEGRFPQWRDVMPAARQRVSHFTFQDAETSDRETAGFHCDGARKIRAETEAKPCYPRSAVVKVTVDARYLAELADAISKVACDAEIRGLDLIVPLDPNGPIVLQRENAAGVTVRAVLMPMKDK